MLFHTQGKAGGPTSKRVIYGASTLNNAKQFLKQVSIIFCVAYLFLLQVMLYTCVMLIGRRCIMLEYKLLGLDGNAGHCPLGCSTV